jgi:hypothetical protein
LFDDPSQALVEHWDGTSWSVVPSAASTGIQVVGGISADVSNDICAVTDSATVLHFDGTNWSQVQTSRPRIGFASLHGITALSPTGHRAMGEEKFCNRCGPDALTDNCGGTTFKGVANSAHGLFSVSAISASKISAVGFEIENWIGANWTTVTTPSGVGSMGGVSTLSDGTVVFISGNAIMENCGRYHPGRQD